MQIVPQYLPQEFGILLLTLALVLAVAPYLFGHDFGVIRVPDFGESMRQRLKWVGPVLLIVAVLIHIPFGPALCEAPKYETVTDRDLCGTDIEEVIINPSRPKTCRHVDFGQEGWERTEKVTQSSGWGSGGSNPTNWCNQLTDGFIQTRSLGSNYKSTVLDNSQESRRDILGHVTYNYHCTIEISWGPKYVEKTDPKCGMLPAEVEHRNVPRKCKKQVGTMKVPCDS